MSNPVLTVADQVRNFDPVDYAIMFGERFLYPWQQDFIRRAWGYGTGRPEWSSLKTCNSSGKTSVVIANLGLAIMAHFAGARIVSTSGSWMQIETQLFPVLKTKLAGLDGWTWSKRGITGPVVEVDGRQLQSTWVPFSTDDPNRAEGHHDRIVYGKSGKPILVPVAYFIDEAKGVADGIFDAQNRCRVSFRLLASSCGTDVSAGDEHIGNFYDSFNRNSEIWTNRSTVDYTMCDHLYKDPQKREQIEADIRLLGREHPIIMSQYFGEFFREKGYFVFNVDHVRSAMSGMLPNYGHDMAGAFDWSAGKDEQVWGVRRGNTQIELKVWHIKDLVSLAKQVKERIDFHKLRPEELVFDDGGGGKELIDLLESWGYKGIVRYRNNLKAGDEIRYANIYTEDSFRLSSEMKMLNLIKDDETERQLRERQYTMPNDDSNRMRLVPKEELRKKGKPSPDRLDMITMLFSRFRGVDFEKVVRERADHCPSVLDCFQKGDKEENTGIFLDDWLSAN